MYPSSNIDSPFESLFIRSFSLDQNPSPNLDDPSLFFQFPSPFLDENELFLNQILSQNLPIGGLNYIANEKSAESNPVNAITPSRKRNLNQTTPLKRTRKKDRHSKISTAQGVRDRRMRLSCPVAQRFFHVQDMLGYDKASKTIDWLFRKSKKAIKDLCKNKPKEKLISSTIDELTNECIENSISTGEQKGDLEKYASLERKKNERKPRQSVYRPNLRESRDKARARARDRTREKMIIKGLENSNKGFESNPIQFSDMAMIEKFLGNSSSNSWPISDDFSNNMIMGFLGNWDVNCDRINSEMTSMIPFAGNPNSVDDVVNSDFPFQQF